jgi:hypothetical protein
MSGPFAFCVGEGRAARQGPDAGAPGGMDGLGPVSAVAIAVKNVSGRRRWSKLDEWLRDTPHNDAAQRWISG